MRPLGLVLVKARLTVSAFWGCPRAGGCVVQGVGQARWEFLCSRPRLCAQGSLEYRKSNYPARTGWHHLPGLPVWWSLAYAFSQCNTLPLSYIRACKCFALGMGLAEFAGTNRH